MSTEGMFPAGGYAQKETRIALVREQLDRYPGLDRLVMSILSDVQEMMERGDLDRGRRWLNLVKWMLDCRAELEDAPTEGPKA